MDPSLSVTARINVIYAMRRHPDKQAVAKLFSLVESPDPQIVEAARSALSFPWASRSARILRSGGRCSWNSSSGARRRSCGSG